MAYALVILIEIVRAVAGLVLISTGLMVIFGMMRVINIAHGEFMMLGGYTVVIAGKAGVNPWVSMLVLAPLIVGLFGVVAERLFIRFFYGRMIDTLLATWGLSLFLIGFVTVVFGNTVAGVSVSLGSVQIGGFRVSGYAFFLIAVAAVLLVATYGVLRHTRWGLIARGTMQNANMAAALGVSPSLVYMTTFGIGSALTGLAGALLSPITGVVPTMGIAFVARAFITVIIGGPAIIMGTISAASLLGTVSQLMTFATTPVVGDVALLFVAVVLLRILPQGITGKLFRRSI
ncbi:MAG TPA: branched-chain amino acid ABC transporter permease [Stellaceae bacterium]|nr:branched-chain amino acid ABC transporter permease [Stellaceae bacterium]